jgi:hypothetical protein
MSETEPQRPSVPTPSWRRVHTQLPAKVDVAIIGSGPGGLVAAAHRCGLNKGSSCFIGFWALVLPITQNLTALVMSDLLLASLCLLAAMAFASFLERPTAGWSTAFGALAAAAILTKASGVALALVPPLSIVLLRRWRLLTNWRLWLAPLPVLVTALPWTLMTMEITQEGMQSKSAAEYLPEAFAFYAHAAGYTFGALILLAAFVAIARALPVLWKRDSTPNTCMVSMGAFCLALLALYLAAPTGLSSRYLLPMVPPLLIAAAFAFRAGRRVWTHPSAEEFCIGIGAACSFIFIFPVHHKVASGFGELAAGLTTRASGGKVLVSSDARGEGSLIAEMAFRTADRCASPWTIVRASKFMASSDWIGRDYQTAFATRENFAAALRREQIQWVIDDRDVPPAYLQKHHQQLREWCGGMTPAAQVQPEREGFAKTGPVLLFDTLALEDKEP